MIAHDGLARALRRCTAPSTATASSCWQPGRRPLAAPGQDAVTALSRLAMLAADCVSRAVARGVYEAEGLGAQVAYRDRFGADA